MFNKTLLLESISRELSAELGSTVKLEWARDMAGGDINHAALIACGDAKWFLKYHRHAPDGMFAAEAEALREISEQGCIRVPKPISSGIEDDTSWLVLEFLDLTASGPSSQLGEQLARLHAVTGEHYGWHRDNYIGSTPQKNTPCKDWADFWRDCRLQPQFVMARSAGHGDRLWDKGERLMECLDDFMDRRQPAASLLHGDLWGGNRAFTVDGQAVIFDPAAYYGDRETDIAMTELFGGFGSSFYAAYRAHSPLPDGYRLRRDLYNLYHMLNHLNLFGAGYLGRCESLIDGLMSQVR